MKKSKLFSLFALLLFATSFITAQELSVGADVVSRYIWRGADVGGGVPAIQPGVEFGYEGLALGVWGSTPLSSAETMASSEIDFYLGYTFSTEKAGEFTLIATDYYYPEAGYKISSFTDDGTGAHLIEAGIGYAGPEDIPLSLYVGVNVFNEEDNTVYAELGYSVPVKDVTLDLFTGVTSGGKKVGYYGASKFGLINLGFKVSKDIKITEDFSLPVFGSWILNPYGDISYFAFGVSL